MCKGSAETGVKKHNIFEKNIIIGIMKSLINKIVFIKVLIQHTV